MFLTKFFKRRIYRSLLLSARTNNFVGWREWLKTASLGRIVLFGIMLPVGSVLEFWASPRLLPVQVMMLLVRFGYRPAFRASTTTKTTVFSRDIRFAIYNTLPSAG